MMSIFLHMTFANIKFMSCLSFNNWHCNYDYLDAKKIVFVDVVHLFVCNVHLYVYNVIDGHLTGIVSDVNTSSNGIEYSVFSCKFLSLLINTV